MDFPFHYVHFKYLVGKAKAETKQMEEEKVRIPVIRCVVSGRRSHFTL